MAISTLHGALILEVGGVAQAANDCRSANALCLAACERGVGAHLHTAITLKNLLDESSASLDSEKSSLCRVVTYGNNNLVEDAQRLVDNGFMTSGKWVERSRKYCYSLHTYIIYSANITKF